MQERETHTQRHSESPLFLSLLVSPCLSPGNVVALLLLLPSSLLQLLLMSSLRATRCALLSVFHDLSSLSQVTSHSNSQRVTLQHAKAGPAAARDAATAATGTRCSRGEAGGEAGRGEQREISERKERRKKERSRRAEQRAKAGGTEARA